MSAEQNTKAVGYVCVESGSQRKREESVYIQRKEILGYAKLNGVQVVRFFSDHSCIEDIALRQGLSDAIAFITSGKAQILAVARLDRLSSSAEDLVRFTEQHRFFDAEPSLVSVTERIDTRKAEGRFAIGVMRSVTHGESEPQGRGA
jgi:DNA invertase Pin-like site-specific DNA recombinase